MSPEGASSGLARPAAGLFVAVVGPSGAGKDSVLAGAARLLGHDPRVLFARRTVTRAADRAAEDHDTMDEAAFAQAERDGAFSLTWQAHGLRYGLAAALCEDVAAGRIAVANVSRGALGAAAARFGSLRIVEITARPELRLARIGARGRAGDDAAARLAREVPLAPPPGVPPPVRIDNSTALEDAVGAFAAHLACLCTIAVPSRTPGP